METAPARCLDVTSDMSQTPNMRVLREHAWVGANHFSTYPYTSRAIFSLMTGWYPTATECFDGECRGQRTSGLMHSLGEQGYVTAAYKPYADSADDEDLQRSEGLSTVFHAAAKNHDDAERHETQAWRQRVGYDRAALKQMKTDIAAWIAKDQRYAVSMLRANLGHPSGVNLHPPNRLPPNPVCLFAPTNPFIKVIPWQPSSSASLSPP